MELSPRFEEAVVFVTRLHSNQLRKGTDVPYVAHLLSLAGIALDHGATEARPSVHSCTMRLRIKEGPRSGRRSEDALAMRSWT
jgi:hypothetical protein